MESSSVIQGLNSQFQNSRQLDKSGSKSDFVILAKHYADLNYPSESFKNEWPYFENIIKEYLEGMNIENKFELAQEAFTSAMANELGEKFDINPKNIRFEDLMPIAVNVNFEFIKVLYNGIMEQTAFLWHEKQRKLKQGPLTREMLDKYVNDTNNNSSTIEDILRHIGFVTYERGLSYNFGNCELTCYLVLDPAAGWEFHGIYKSQRSMGFLEFLLPLKVETVKSVLALLAYYLRNADFKNVPVWLTFGLELHDELPWKKKAALEAAEYNAIPKATIDHEWYRLIKRKLVAIAETTTQHDLTTFSFESNVLTITGTTTQIGSSSILVVAI